MKTNTAILPSNVRDTGYDQLLKRLQQRFLTNTNQGTAALFLTDAEGLWETYLGSFSDTDQRQYHTCHACRQFITRFGGLATIDLAGRVIPLLWNEEDVGDEYEKAFTLMAKAVRRAKIDSVFLSPDRVWGTPKTGEWTHLSITPTAEMLYKGRLLTAGQAMAEKSENFKTVMRALQEFSPACLETAVTLLKTDALYRSEKVLGQAEWLLALRNQWETVRGNARSNLLWQAVATAPAGFCHPRSSMIGTLLEDITAGKDFGDVSRAFAAKMHPLAYQRPQAAPSIGAIAAAEKAFEKLGAASSLPRRFARLDEVQAIWKPAQKKKDALAEGIFGHLKPVESSGPAISIPDQTMTWDKFSRSVLPTAECIEILAPSHGSYSALVTAVNSDAPAILQWDSEEKRNPVSWYFWNGGAPSAQFSVRGGSFVTVEAVAFKPSMWNDGNEHQGKGVMFVMAGAKETRNAGGVLFPEILKSEYHAFRSVIEAFSKKATIEGMEQPHAAGIMVNAGSGERWNVTLRVWSNGKPLGYKLDRWD